MSYSAPDCPILVWMLSLNREYTKEEYDACFDVVKECIKHVQLQYEPRDANSFRRLMTLMLPLLMMRHRRIPRAKWLDNENDNGKHWIQHAPEDMSAEKFRTSMIGYSLHYESSLCGMAMTQGIMEKVVTIGLGFKQYAVEPRGASIEAYVESCSHKFTHFEMQAITELKEDEAMLRRLCVTLALKQAYIKAIGQPLGFDFSRLEFNVKDKTAKGDGFPLIGWEFRIFRVNLGVARGEDLVQEYYECATAFFRNTPDTKFLWHSTQKELESWVQFINIDQMIKVTPKLTA